MGSHPRGAAPVMSWPPVGWRCCPAAGGLAGGLSRRTSSIVWRPKQGWLARRVKSHRLGQRDRPRQLALAKNQGKSSIAPTCRAFGPKGGWRRLPRGGFKAQSCSYHFPVPQLPNCISKKPLNDKKKGWRRLRFFLLVSSALSTVLTGFFLGLCKFAPSSAAF